jgi:hypothetical protein
LCCAAEFPVLEVRNGTWRFSKDDEPSFANRSIDDSKWRQVSVPHDWREPPASHTGAGVVGWYRRTIDQATPGQIKAASAGTLKLGLGTVANVRCTPTCWGVGAGARRRKAAAALN